MSDAIEMLRRLEAAGAHARLAGNPTRLVVGPERAISPQLRAELQQAAVRRELVQLLLQQVWATDPPSLPWQMSPGEDPRPDLPGSALWGQLLRLAAGDADDPAGTYGRLKAARACGVLLERRGNGWKLSPTIDPTERLSVWADRDAWDRDAERWLRPHSRRILKLLRQLPPPGGAAGG